MGVVWFAEILDSALEFRGMCPPLPEDGLPGSETASCGGKRAHKGGSAVQRADGGAAHGQLPVCVTCGTSYIGRAIVDRLLRGGYSVRVAVESQDDLEKLEQMKGREGGRVSAVAASVTDVDGLCVAFAGCGGVFHTSAFLDPAGISGYSKHKAGIEAAAAGKVVEACARTPSVRRCVFTSSLLACIWRRRHLPGRGHGDPLLLDESCWSDETLCRDKKLWLALGKTMAESAAWRAARERGVKLAALCPALLTGPGSCSGNASSSVAYLKGGTEMFADGLLATAEVSRVAEAHVCVYEAMGRGEASCGRYICFDRVVRTDEDAAELGRQLGLADRLPGVAGGGGASADGFQLSDGKLRRLMSRRMYPYGVPADMYH